MCTVLVTGVAGFIGSHLAAALLAEGATVRGIDNLSTGSLHNLEGMQHRIDFRHGDVNDASAVSDAVRGVEFVFHQAAVASVEKSIHDPLCSHATNLTATLNLLLAAETAGVRRVLFAASSAAYGDGMESPKHEGMLAAPMSPYAIQKLCSELYMKCLYRLRGLDTVALRYFNVFGPRQDPHSPYSGVLARFISQMLEDETPTIFGDGLTSRDFTYIDNVVQANLLAARADAGVAGRLFNVGTGRSVTLLDAFHAIRGLTGYRGTCRHQPERLGDVRHSVADISSASSAFGYEVATAFETGLEQTVAWYREKTYV